MGQSVRVFALVCLGLCFETHAIRQRVVITNNSNARAHICVSTTTCDPLARPAIDPKGHDNLYVPFADGAHRFSLFIATNYQGAHYVLDYHKIKKTIVLSRDSFELESYPCARGLGSKVLPLVITPDFNLIFDKNWNTMTTQMMPEFPGTTFHFKKCNCRPEPFPRLRKRALKKRGIAVAANPPVEDKK